MTLIDLAVPLALAAHRRTDEIVDALRDLGDDLLLGSSTLPGWSRLTIACHLRFGADAVTRMSDAALLGRPVAYYPEGRDQQRPATLRRGPQEAPADVVASLATSSATLHQRWSSLRKDQWQCDVVEPDDNLDLGRLPLAALPLLRLTEVEVHGTDLDLSLTDWSDLFIRIALPFRLDWLNTRRVNHRAFDASKHASWLLAADDGPIYLVSADGRAVNSRPATLTTTADAVIHGSSRDLLALLLGRPTRQTLRYRGDESIASSFGAVFPGP